MTNKPVKLPATEHTNVEIGDDSVLYIRLVENDFGPQRKKQMIKDVKKQFEKMLPDTSIIVGDYDLRFTSISKKQAFKGKLDGQIRS